MPETAPRRVRKRVFGRDPEAYDRARLAYPPQVYDILTTRCGLRPSTSVFEIGPGTGIATRQLLKLGANPITLVEPDRRLARFLANRLRNRSGRVRIEAKPFERVKLPRGGFDLGVAATSFHWLPERLALRKVARALRHGGWWATWNNHHGDPYRPSAFQDALQPLYYELSGRAKSGYTKARARKDRRDRLRALKSIVEFERVSRDDIRWTATLGTARVQALWGTFSDVVTLRPVRRVWFLSELGRIVDDQFDGKVDIPVLTPVYTARRR
ncbi:MAG: class I SAM-dependent methyltransferase [Thermoplasmata archaeon]|nr:class I SAM-dependent methyltransferase [Thermoplasmata archaeon]